MSFPALPCPFLQPQPLCRATVHPTYTKPIGDSLQIEGPETTGPKVVASDSPQYNLEPVKMDVRLAGQSSGFSWPSRSAGSAELLSLFAH